MRPATSRGASLKSAGGSSGLILSDGSSFKGAMQRSVMTAATGRSLLISNADISKRPVTGAGGLARQKSATASKPRVVESVGFYSNLLQQKTEQIVKEIHRLEYETEMCDSTSDARKKLEHDHKNEVNEVKQLEAALTDLNLAKDKARSGANHEDVRNEAIEVAKSNKALERKIDEVFVSRKRIESQTLKLESKLQQMRNAMEHQFMNDPEMIYKYRMFLDIMEGIQAEGAGVEAKLKDANAQLESTVTDDSHARQKQAKERVTYLEHQIAQIDSDLELIAIDEHEARKHLLDKVKRVDKQQIHLDKKSAELQSEIESLFKEQAELRTKTRLQSYEPTEVSTAVELFREQLNEQKNFLDSVPAIKERLEQERKRLMSTIETLQKEVGEKRTATQLHLPSREELKLMQTEVDFTTKHLDNNRATMTRLRQQKQAREMELEKIIALEDKIDRELQDIEAKTFSMKQEMLSFQTQEEVQASSDERRDHLIELTEEYALNIERLESQLNEASVNHAKLKEALENEPNWKSIELLKTKLSGQEEEINVLQKELDEAEAKSGYQDMKADCLALVDKINGTTAARQ